MARDQRLNVDITATDSASAEITDVARKVERLDGETADVKIEADTSDADGGIAGIADALDSLGVVKNVNVTSGGNAGPSQAGAVMSSLSWIAAPSPRSMVTVLVTARSVSGPSITSTAVALLNAGTGFGSNVTGSVMSVI